MAYDVPLSTRVTEAVDLRLRMLALATRQPLNHVLNGVLDKALPTAEELAARLGSSQDAALETEAA